MPIRITCPSCSSTLSVRDEYAGRAVKCPKCAGIIPPQQAPATVSEPEAVATVPPPPAPPPGPFDEPEKPAGAGGKTADGPAHSRAEADDREDDRPRKRRDEEHDEERPRERDDRGRDEDERPRRRRRDEDDYEDRPPRRRRDEDDYDDDDRPRRRRAADDYDDDYDDDDRPARRRRNEDRPAQRRPQGGSNVGLIVAGAAILVCVVMVVAGYFVYSQREAENKAILDAASAEKEAKEKAAEKAAAEKAGAAGYEKVKIGDTRAQADTALGKNGRTATVEDLSRVFRAPADKRRLGEWTPKVREGRAVLWQSGEDGFVLVMFHPNPEPGGRVQAKVLRSKAESSNAGDLDDAAFLKRYPSKEPGEPKVNPPKGEVLP